MLRRVRASQERMEFDISGLKTRTNSIEIVLGQVITLLAGQSGRLDLVDA